MNAPWFSPKVLGGFLLFSIALNFFLAGMLIGRFKAPHPTGSESRLERMIERMAAGLPEHDGEILREVFLAHRAHIAQLVSDLEAAREDARKAFKRDPFDQAELTDAFVRQRHRRQAVHEAVHGVILETAPRLSADGRRQLGEWGRER
jgi:uncharacterized membrane protein